MLKGLYQLCYRHLRAIRYSGQAATRTPWTTIMAIIAVALTLLLPLLFWFLVHAFKPLTHDWREGKEISLYLNMSFDIEAKSDLVKRVKQVPGVAKVYFISADDSLKALEKEEGMTDLRTYLPENPLPSMIEVTPKPSVDTAVKMERLFQTLKAFPEVEEARLNREWVTKLHALMAFLGDLTWFIGGLFGLMVIFMIRNLLSLTAEAHHEEIQVLKLIGATDAFILRPFLYTGVLLGGLGACGAVLGGYFILWRLSAVLEPLTGFSLSFMMHLSLVHILMCLSVGMLLGWFGAYLSLRHQLSHIEPCH